MPERGFETGFWTEPFVKRLSVNGKILLCYLSTNDHCNQAGVYQIALETISSETGIPLETVPELLKKLRPKVEWYPETDTVWVCDFISQQAKSPKFLIAAAKCLRKLNNNGLAKEIVNYNLKRYTISIPYEYSTDTVSILPVSDSVSVSNTSNVSKEDEGSGEGTKAGNKYTSGKYGHMVVTCADDLERIKAERRRREKPPKCRSP